uniref:Kinesin-associated protein 3 n=1 Tax=Heterorhabditis bacteriophora TaxID=37862 RepID=A0A1I7XMF8_HETBA
MFEIPDIDVHLATHINLKDLNSDVDISVLAEVILEKCSIIPDHLRHELEQVLFYLQKRTNSVNRKSTSSISSLLNENGLTCSIKADIDQIENYIELFYENVADKNRGVLCILELTKTISNLQYLIENETLIGALARVFREDWRKNFDLGTNIIKIFVELSSYNQFQATLSHHRIGALCLNAIEYELRRGDIWADSIRNGDEKTAKKCRLAIRKQHILLAACINLLINLAHDVSVELKMVRRDIVPMLLKCLDYRDSRELILVTVQFLLKLSIFEENKAIMLMRDILSGGGSEVTKAVLLNACIERRNAQLVCGPDGQGLCNGHHLVSWMGEQLKSILNGREPLQLQLVIMCGSMARQLEAARNLIPLLDVFLQLLHCE